MIRLSEEFLNRYTDFPEDMEPIAQFTYLRTYSRYLPEYGRREVWKETVKRATEYNINLAYRHYSKTLTPAQLLEKKKELEKEAELLFDNMFYRRQFCSGRTLWVGNASTGVADKYPLANFNCSFTNIEDWEDLCDLFYLLLVGTGVGFKTTKKLSQKMKPIRNRFRTTHEMYRPVAKSERLEHSKLEVHEQDGCAKITIGDSKEGWVESLRYFFQLLTQPEYEKIEHILFNYDSVRPKGERLKTFGGTASGHEPLMEMFQGIEKVLKNQVEQDTEPLEEVQEGYVRVRPVHVLDIANRIGYNVVVGGVRRTAEICLFDYDDYETLFAKYGINGLWGEEAFTRHELIKQKMIQLGIPVPKWWDKLSVKYYDVHYAGGTKTFTDADEARRFAETQGISDYVPFPYNNSRPLHHRRMSNNSIAFRSQPSKDYLDFVFLVMRSEGEPGFVNLEEMARRRLAQKGITEPTSSQLEETMDEVGMNPCAEIILKSKNVCNLTTVNVKAFVKDGRLQLDQLIEAQKLSARIGYRMTLVDLELPHWDVVQKEERLLGTSLTGWKDAMGEIGADEETEKQLLETLGRVAREEADRYAKELGLNRSLLVTSVKPEGTLSLVAGAVSSGLHWSHSPYYIRRIRITADDPLAKACLEHKGWVIHPEVGTPGQTYEEQMKNARTLVIDFPVKSGAKRTKDSVDVHEQFRTYFMFQKYYTEHNSSNTITVKPHEWEEACEIVYKNWKQFIGVSFLSYDGGSYPLAPYEACTEEKYHQLVSQMEPFDFVKLLKYEIAEDTQLDETMEDCASGVCPIR
ncbi:ribonucleoside-triphosphate reductase, adenosylcobalamin-dependent [Thermoflavimicrobium dichotomicum]|uniref:Adenosylcobalamin-dependent ribonucleoside-triphosphate reductase n=1 Tax=Thermoflavimicrobium dichotomicum TaxID=46223 RepID=A0A1I3VEJ9_9BACL|nr:ribonucleoside-triphosphate reductase, adenosylcobalamin-dependent [Thermoflavimicrobium dichotomicum]SFJ93695.1 ribonucleoside-triphosphate reductase, adenosylcobalamin-dependent [Thermoflavimicrobium dichotomicum]